MPPRSKRRTGVGKWLLKSNFLVPKKDLLLAHCTHLSMQPPPDDPLITFRFPSAPCSSSANTDVLIHKSRLTLAGGPLSALVNAGFVESNQRLIRLSDEDSSASFRVIRKFLYCQPINIPAEVRIDMAVIAHRWQLTDLFNAFFVHAEQQGCIYDAVDIYSFFPLMCKIQVPAHFKSYLAIEVSHHFTDLLHLLGLRIPPNEVQAAPKQRCKRTETPHPKRHKPDRTVATAVPALSNENTNSPSLRSDKSLNDIVEAAQSEARNRLQTNIPKIRAEYAASPMSVWEMFHSQDMLGHIIHYVSRYTAPDYAGLFLDVILRVLEPILPDEDVIALLRQLDWESVRRSDALGESATLKWSVRALRLLAVTQSELLARGVSELRMRWKLGHLPQAIADHEGGDFSSKSADFPFERRHFNLQASCTDCSPSYMSPFIVRVNLVRDESMPLDNRKVSVRVRAIEAGCGCERSDAEFKRGSFRGFQARRLHGGDNDSVPMAAFAGRGGVPFVLLPGSDFGKWLNRHQPTCGLVIQAVLRFGQVVAENEVNNGGSCRGSGSKDGAHRDAMRRALARRASRRPLCSCGLHHIGERLDEDEDDVDDEDSDGSGIGMLHHSGMSFDDGFL